MPCISIKEEFVFVNVMPEAESTLVLAGVS
jgi:hypothetical protein